MTAPVAVLIVGGTSGIGLGIARAFGASGRAVALAGRDPQRCRDAVASPCESAPSDVLVSHALTRCGRLDGLVTAAGMRGRGSLLDLKTVTLKAAWRRNTLGAWHAIRGCLLSMLESRFRRIVMVGLVLGDVGAPERAGHAAIKAAVTALPRSAAHELAGTGVTVNCMVPEPIRTWEQPADIAHLVLQQLAAESGWTTGSIVHVGGGYTPR